MRVAAALIGAALAVPAVAAASIQQDMQLANQVWHTPCGGIVTVERWSDPTGDLAGEALFNTDTRPYTGCVIRIDVDYLRWLAGDPVEARELVCTVLLHEAGHTAGMEHSTDPDSVMYPTLDHIDPRCERLYRKDPS